MVATRRVRAHPKLGVRLGRVCRDAGVALAQGAHLEFRIQGLGSRVLGSQVSGFGIRVYDLRCRV